MYQSFVAGILNTAKRTQFFVLCNDEFNYEDYIERFIGDKECSVSYKSDSGLFLNIVSKLINLYLHSNKSISETPI